ncbi:MAG TPA: response regulator transcription factor [Candidatus Acidoferrales bacterium]|nr:response regulator transcription factor [Candidatus Acidoferrales bacterium]
MGVMLLIVEDDRRIATLVVKNLEAAGYDCTIAADGEQAIHEFARIAPALVVLDVGLPGLGGLEVTRRLRQHSDVPILMLTARSSEADKVLGLEIGADDYLTKPFSTAELVARVRALLRRTLVPSRERPIVAGTLRIDPARREAERDGAPLGLTTLEFDVLYFLASRSGRVFSREALMEEVWGTDRIVGERSIDNLVSRLRRKLEPDPEKPRWLQTVWGAGYRFDDGGA